MRRPKSRALPARLAPLMATAVLALAAVACAGGDSSGDAPTDEPVVIEGAAGGSWGG